MTSERDALFESLILGLMVNAAVLIFISFLFLVFPNIGDLKYLGGSKFEQRSSHWLLGTWTDHYTLNAQCELEEVDGDTLSSENPLSKTATMIWLRNNAGEVE